MYGKQGGVSQVSQVLHGLVNLKNFAGWQRGCLQLHDTWIQDGSSVCMETPECEGLDKGSSWGDDNQQLKKEK